MSTYKILLEQGNPFPCNFDKDIKMRFLMSGALLSGVVISNCYKSEDLYKIVLPREEVPYRNIDELIEDKISIYTPISNLWGSFQHENNECGIPFIKTDDLYIKTCKNNSFKFSGYSNFFIQDQTEPEFMKLFNYTQFHPMAKEALVELTVMLDDLMKVGIIDTNNSEKLTQGQLLEDVFKSTQEELIIKSLHNCSKTAWMIEDYLLQPWHISCQKFEKYSGISSKAYENHTLSFKFINSYVPSLLLRRVLWIQTNGLYE